jgi:hypothetical protein
MTINLPALPGRSVTFHKATRMTCTNPDHTHRDPVIDMLGIYVNDHYVEITRDGDRYNVRIDQCHTRFSMTEAQMNQYIQEHTAHETQPA